MLAADLGIGGVDVDHVDLPGTQRVVGNAMVETGWMLRQRVACGDGRPAVGAAEKFVRQAEAQRRVHRQIGEGADVLAFGVGLAHGERVGVFKAERHARSQAHGAKCAVYVGQQCGLIRIGRLCLRQVEDFGGDGAEVVGVGVNAAVLERGKDDGGVTQARYVFGWAALGGGLREDFAQHVRLGEALGADAQR